MWDYTSVGAYIDYAAFLVALADTYFYWNVIGVTYAAGVALTVHFDEEPGEYEKGPIGATIEYLVGIYQDAPLDGIDDVYGEMSYPSIDPEYFLAYGSE
jgi:hypothetical protein